MIKKITKIENLSNFREEEERKELILSFSSLISL